MGLVSDKWVKASDELKAREAWMTVGRKVRVSEWDNGDTFHYDARIVAVDTVKKTADVVTGENTEERYTHPFSALNPYTEAGNPVKVSQKENQSMTNVGMEEREILVEWTEKGNHHMETMKANKLDAFALQKYREGVDVDKDMAYWRDRHNVKVAVQAVSEETVLRRK